MAALWWQEVGSLPLPAAATTVTVRMLPDAELTALEAAADVAVRGVGFVRAP